MDQRDRMKLAMQAGEARERARQKKLEQQRMNAMATRPRKVCPACGKAFQQLEATQNWCAGCLTRKAYHDVWEGKK